MLKVAELKCTYVCIIKRLIDFRPIHYRDVPLWQKKQKLVLSGIYQWQVNKFNSLINAFKDTRETDRQAGRQTKRQRDIHSHSRTA